MGQLLFNFQEKIYPNLELVFGDGNQELLQALNYKTSHAIYIWGPANTGKSHFLDIWVKQQLAKSRKAILITSANITVIKDLIENNDYEYFAIDDIDKFNSAEKQALLFYLLNDIFDRKHYLLTTSVLPPQSLDDFRTDIKTRLGLCLVYQLHRLSEEGKKLAIQEYIKAKQSNISAEVIQYLIMHLPRDLNSLLTMIEQLDNYALSNQRKITIPLLKQFLLSKEKYSEK